MSVFKNITFSKLLYEYLGSDLGYNKLTGKLSILYRYLYAMCYMLQEDWDAYDVYRRKWLLIAKCKPTVYQLQETLKVVLSEHVYAVLVTNCTYIRSDILAPNVEDAAKESDILAPNIDESESSIFAPNINENNYFSRANIAVTIKQGSTIDDVKYVVDSILIAGINKFNINYTYTYSII